MTLFLGKNNLFFPLLTLGALIFQGCGGYWAGKPESAVTARFGTPTHTLSNDKGGKSLVYTSVDRWREKSRYSTSCTEIKKGITRCKTELVPEKRCEKKREQRFETDAMGKIAQYDWRERVVDEVCEDIIPSGGLPPPQFNIIPTPLDEKALYKKFQEQYHKEHGEENKKH